MLHLLRNFDQVERSGATKRRKVDINWDEHLLCASVMEKATKELFNTITSLVQHALHDKLSSYKELMDTLSKHIKFVQEHVRPLRSGGTTSWITPVAGSPFDSDRPTQPLNQVNPTLFFNKHIERESQCDSDASTKSPSHGKPVVMEERPSADGISPWTFVT